MIIFRMDLLYVRGKRGGEVPVILTSDVVKAMISLIDSREKVGIPCVASSSRGCVASSICSSLSLNLI